MVGQGMSDDLRSSVRILNELSSSARLLNDLITSVRLLNELRSSVRLLNELRSSVLMLNDQITSVRLPEARIKPALLCHSVDGFLKYFVRKFLLHLLWMLVKMFSWCISSFRLVGLWECDIISVLLMQLTSKCKIKWRKKIEYIRFFKRHAPDFSK